MQISPIRKFGLHLHFVSSYRRTNNIKSFESLDINTGKKKTSEEHVDVLCSCQCRNPDLFSPYRRSAEVAGFTEATEVDEGIKVNGSVAIDRDWALRADRPRSI